MSTRLARRAVKAIIPSEYHFAIRTTGFRLLHSGNARFCRCCGSSVRAFKPFGPVHKPRPNAQCPVCSSLERDRLVSLYFDRNPEPLLQARRVLHVAPERSISHMLRRRGNVDYLSIDLAPGAAMKAMDLTAMTFDDESFDAVYCSNVLEHVSDDRQAMDEIFRVLRPGAWSMILVPLYAERSHEDPSITDPDERTRLYGQPDHVRAYGPDVTGRLEAAGFDVEVAQPGRHLSAEDAVRQGIDREEIVFFCRKPRIARKRQRSAGYAEAGAV